MLVVLDIRSGSRSVSTARSSSARSSSTRPSTGPCSGETAPAEWLPFLIPITVLVFWQAGLYADARAALGPRPRRSRRSCSSPLITVAFALGNGHEFTTYGLLPTACATCALSIGLLRAAYDSVIVELQRVLRVRRRAVLVGGRDNVAGLHRTLVAARGGVDYDFAGAVGDEAPPGLRQLGTLDRLAVDPRETRPDELILSEGDFDEAAVLEIVETAHRAGVKVRLAPKTTELLIQRGEYVPGQGAPLFELRPPVLAGTDWLVKRSFDLVVSVIVLVVGLPLWLLIAAAIKLDSPRAGPLPRPADRRRPARVRDAQVPDDGAGRGRAAGRARGAERGRRARSSRSARTRASRASAGCCGKLSLDELPQVLNVLGGEMSLVGPRPLPLRDYEQLEAWHRKRYLVLPGITGPLADLRPLEPHLRRPRAARLLLHRELVDLARHLDPLQDARSPSSPAAALTERLRANGSFIRPP